MIYYKVRHPKNWIFKNLEKVLIMVSEVTLAPALRNNLLSLQNTQRLIDDTQLRLATGLRVNSALDNPQNFFTSQSLNNRASDLTRLLDGISQSIQTINQANNGIEALTDLVEQADAIAQTAREELQASSGTARAVGSIDLRGVADLTTLTAINDQDQFEIITTNADGTQISETIIINAGDTASALTARITNQFADNQNSEISASVTDNGFLVIQSNNNSSFRVVDGLIGSGNEVGDLGFDALGLGDFFESEFTTVNGPLETRIAATIVANNTINSVSLFESSGNLAEAGDVLSGTTFQNADGETVISDLDGSTFFVRTRSDAGTVFPTFVVGDTITFQDIADFVNGNDAINQLVRADFDNATGQLSFTALSDELDNFEVGVFRLGSATFDIGLGDPTGNLDPRIGGGGFFSLESRAFSFNQSNQALDDLADEFNNIREQINQLVTDTDFRGINLLGNDDLTTFFNEDNSNALVTEGANFTADGLGLTETNFSSPSEIEETASQIRDALGTIREFGSSLANNLSIIESRFTFTQDLINTLNAGADDLTLADQNDEGANLLALQTRQALGTTALSLASQSQQSVLRLF